MRTTGASTPWPEASPTTSVRRTCGTAQATTHAPVEPTSHPTPAARSTATTGRRRKGDTHAHAPTCSTDRHAWRAVPASTPPPAKASTTPTPTCRGSMGSKRCSGKHPTCSCGSAMTPWPAPATEKGTWSRSRRTAPGRTHGTQACGILGLSRQGDIPSRNKGGRRWPPRAWQRQHEKRRRGSRNLARDGMPGNHAKGEKGRTPLRTPVDLPQWESPRRYTLRGTTYAMNVEHLPWLASIPVLWTAEIAMGAVGIPRTPTKTQYHCCPNEAIEHPCNILL